MNEKTSNRIFTNTFHRNVVFPFERLATLVRIIPAWVPANLITTIRGLLIIPIYFAYRHSEIAWVIFFFLLGVFTDTVDGVHARYRHQISNAGKILDPAADKILIIGTLILVAPGRLSPYIIYVIIILETALVLLAVLIGPLFATRFGIKIKLGSNIFGKIKFPLEGLAFTLLLLGIDNRIIQLLSECILWCAAFFAFLSIVFHVVSTGEVNPPAN